MSRTDILVQAIHPITGDVYNFSPLEATMELPFSRRTSTAQQPGVSGEIDLLGTKPGPANKRQCSSSFVVPYDGSFVTAKNVPITNFTDAYDELVRQCGHGRPMKLIKKTGQNPPTFRYCTARITDIPEKSDLDSMSAAYFTITFEMARPWWRGDPAGWHLWDDPTLTWDDATLFWDVNPMHYALTSASVDHTFDNVGSLDDPEPRVEIYGPYPGPITVANMSIPISGGRHLSFSWANPLLAGDVLIVDVGAGTVTLNGANAFDARFSVPLGQDKWFRLVTGTNVINISTPTAGTYNGDVIWSTDPHYA